MLTISKALSASQARTYHAREFVSERQNYWSRDTHGFSEWHGTLAQQWSLSGAVSDEAFSRLSEGQHPQDGMQLVKHQPARTYENEYGKQITSSEHRAGWDATFSAPKSVSLTALVGDDDRVREAHRESVRIAVQELERYTQARIGNVHAPETTGKFAAAAFEHDTARPVDGYAAPQLHTHVVIFNVTERGNGETRALQERSLFQSQHYATSVYRSELANRLQRLGYEIKRGRHGQPEIKGYTQEYLEASSPRRTQIKEHLEEIGREGAGAAQVAAHRTRDSKEIASQDAVLARHRELAERYGNQPDQAVAQARQPKQRIEATPSAARTSVTYARDVSFERSAVQDERSLLQAALDRSMGNASYAEIRQEFKKRVANGELLQVGTPVGRAAQQYTSAEMMGLEREMVGLLRKENESKYQNSMLLSHPLRIHAEDLHPELTKAQRAAVDEIFLSHEKIVGLDGVAGAGKTTTLSVIRHGAEMQGYTVRGFAPTSRAAQKLAEAGMSTSTLQHHLMRSHHSADGEKRLFILDESSLASTRQMHAFLSNLDRNDRVLLVGDTRQHEGVEAGRPFAQLQEAGLRTVKLDEILRQRNPALKLAVEHLAQGQVASAIDVLEQYGNVHEINQRADRFNAIAREYASSRESTLVVSPDNQSRMEINQQIHKELQQRGLVGRQDYRVKVLVARQELTGAERGWAQRYQVDDVVRYSRTSKETGIRKDEYARVLGVDSEKNMLTVARADGSQTIYDPRRQVGVTVYREQERLFAVGDRIQFTAPDREHQIVNRELGTIRQIQREGFINVALDGGREVELRVKSEAHLDHGYAVTSYSSQGQTAERVLVHVDSELSAKDLLNHRMAYVALSRGRSEAQIFTNDQSALVTVLSRDVSQASAYVPQQALPGVSHKVVPSPTHGLEQGRGLGLAM
jgi:conjugative relaxase-like TrwC/TraI family protein